MGIKETLDESMRQGVITPEQRARIMAIDEMAPAAGGEKKRGLNAVMMFYYFGALIIIFAFTYFLVSQWNSLPIEAVLALALGFQAACFGIGVYLRQKLNYNISGGLLVSAAVAITPLTVYCLEKMLGLWPAEGAGKGFDYHGYWMLIKPCWVYIELATLVVAAAVLYWVRFSFIVVIIGHTAWFLSMDLAELILGGHSYGEPYWEARKWVSIVISAAMIGVAKLLNHRTREDYSLWLFIYGGLVFTTATSFTWLENELAALFYLAIHVGFVVASVLWQRKSLLIFGGIGIYAYLAHLAYNVFRSSPYFPIVLAFTGLLMILGAVSFQRNKGKILALFR